MRRLSALLLLGAAVLAGCGDSPKVVRASDGVLRVTLDEYRLRPANLEVRAGRIHLEAHNAGRLTHNLVVESFVHEDGQEAHLYGRTDTLHPGQSGSEQAPIVLKPGKYRLTCSIGNHDDLGQWGELKVLPRRGGEGS